MIMPKISNRALISRLYSSVDELLKEADYKNKTWSEWYELVQGLTDPEKMVFVMVKLNQTVTSGGFANFYESSLGIFAPEIVYVLHEIKAVATAEIVSSTLPVVNPAGLLDEAYKEFIFNIQLSEQQRAQLYTQDVQYDQLHGHENLEDLLGGYLQEMIK
jgi:hypothetical protein